MRDELPTLLAWQQDGAAFALATVVDTSASAPRPAGAALAVHPDGRVVGNVSGGCVEPAVVELATAVLADGASRRARFGYSDDEALAVGLTCGGSVDVLVRRVDAARLPLAPLAAAIAADRPAAVVTVVEHPDGEPVAGSALVVTEDDAHGELLGIRLGEVLTAEGRGALAGGGTALRHLGPDGERMGDELTVLIEVFAPRPHLIVFGAIDYAGALTTLGRFLGYRVTVCDARARFATAERFPDADEVVVEWPHRYLARTPVDHRTAVCVLTHDPKFDVPALVEALSSPAGFVGAMGSRRTHEDRLERLREAGLGEDALARLRSPVGLDLGGRSPQETAVSIAAELVMLRGGGSGTPLTMTSGPIHRGPGRRSPTGEVRTEAGPTRPADSPAGRDAGIVLAAGSSRRFEGTKLTAGLGGRPLVRHPVDLALACGLDPVVVVVGHVAAEVEAVLPDDPRVIVVRNPHHAHGQSTSLRAGLEALAALLPAGERSGAADDVAVVLLGDQPDVAPGAIAAVIAGARDYGAPVTARYADTAAPPVAVPRRSWASVADAVQGDAGVRSVRDEVGLREVRIEGVAPRDVDTRDDLAALTTVAGEGRG